VYYILVTMQDLCKQS